MYQHVKRPRLSEPERLALDIPHDFRKGFSCFRFCYYTDGYGENTIESYVYGENRRKYGMIMHTKADYSEKVDKNVRYSRLLWFDDEYRTLPKWAVQEFRRRCLDDVCIDITEDEPDKQEEPSLPAETINRVQDIVDAIGTEV